MSGDDCSGSSCRGEAYWIDEVFCGWQVRDGDPRTGCVPEQNSYHDELQDFGMFEPTGSAPPTTEPCVDECTEDDMADGPWCDGTDAFACKVGKDGCLNEVRVTCSGPEDSVCIDWAPDADTPEAPHEAVCRELPGGCYGAEPQPCDDGCNDEGTGCADAEPQPDPDPVCDDPCSEGETECSGDPATLVSCIPDPDLDGCLDWGAPVTCAEGFCGDSTSCGSCDHECPVVGTTCNVDGMTLETCTADGDGCRTLSTLVCDGGCNPDDCADPVVAAPEIFSPTACEELTTTDVATLSFTVSDLMGIDRFTLDVKEVADCNEEPTGGSVSGYPVTNSAATPVVHVVESLLPGTWYQIEVTSDADPGYQSASTLRWLKTRAEPCNPIVISDSGLDNRVRAAAGVPSGLIRPEDVEDVDQVAAVSYGVDSLEGLQCLSSLRMLTVSYGNVTDLSPLATLSSLESLVLEHHSGLSDLSPLSSLAGLWRLWVVADNISDLSPLLPLVNLGELDIKDNPINCQEQDDEIAAIEANGVAVYSNCP